MHQYLDLCRRIVEEGEWVANERTGKRCLTVINADLQYSVERNEFPIITTRKSYWKAAIAELLGYLRGYDNAADFRALGTKSWDANSNETPRGLLILCAGAKTIWVVCTAFKAERGQSLTANRSTNCVK